MSADLPQNTLALAPRIHGGTRATTTSMKISFSYVYVETEL